MTTLLRALACALPLLAASAVHAQKAPDTSVTWTRVTVTSLCCNQPVPVLTVPSTATKPIFLRQTFTTTYSGRNNEWIACDLHVSGAGSSAALLSCNDGPERAL